MSSLKVIHAGPMWTYGPFDHDTLPKRLTLSVLSFIFDGGKMQFCKNSAYKKTKRTLPLNQNVLVLFAWQTLSLSFCEVKFWACELEDGEGSASMATSSSCDYSVRRWCKEAWWGCDSGDHPFWHRRTEQRGLPKGVCVRNSDVGLSSGGHGRQGRPWTQHLGCFHQATR